MPRFMVWNICFLLLSGNFLGATTWGIRFPDGVIETGMVPSLWNNFLRTLLYFVVVRSNHGERLVRISLFLELMSVSLG